MDSWAEKRFIDKWDNTGFQIGNEEKQIERLLISLDIDKVVLDKAVKENYQMIINHHPIIFKPLNSITNKNYQGNLIYELIKNDIVVYNAHSNLDIANEGVNDQLANILDLEDIEVLKYVDIDNNEKYGYGRLGRIDNISTRVFIAMIKNKLNIDSLRVYGYKEINISKVAVCGGSGSDFILDAYEAGADLYITGDIKYHDAQLANQLGIIIVDAGHYNTEKIILKKIKENIARISDNNLQIDIFDYNSAKYKIF